MHHQLKLVWCLFTITAALGFSAVRGAEQPAHSDTGAVKTKPAPSRDSTLDQRTTSTNSTQKVDLNAASQEELQRLPGVGPATAKAIVAARPFKSVNELTNVNGISEARFSKLKPLVSVRPARPTPQVGRAAPGEKASATSHPTTSTARPTGQKINLNTATKEELESLPEIGAVRAQAIIDGRPYTKPEDVMKVNGIKEGIYDRIKDQITVR
jgi:competence protein ComEA